MKELVEAATSALQNAYREGRAKALGLPAAEVTIPNEFFFEALASAAVKATLEHLSENASVAVLSADPGTATCDNVTWSRAKLRAMCLQALKEMEG